MSTPSSAARTWYRVQNAQDGPSTIDIHIVDFIGSWDDDWFARNFGYEMGVTAKAFIDELAALPESVRNIHLHINSPGGDVQGGINIANALREQQASKGRTVETFIDGIAASIASVIAMAGSKVHIGDNALMMVHNPWSLAIGNATEMRKVADVLDTMRGQIVATYRWHSEKSDDELVALMDAETWLDADAAIAAGLATDKVTGLAAAASINPRAMAALKLSVPAQFKPRVDALLSKAEPTPVAAAATEVLRVCREADCLELAESLIAKGATLPDVQASVAKARDEKQQSAARAQAITAACQAAKLPGLAEGYIKGVMALDDVKAHLVTITAVVDKAEIDTNLDPDRRTPPAGAALSTAAIYAARNARP